MKVWQVWDGDYDGDWVVATYDSEALAREHAETYGLSRIEEVEIQSKLPSDAVDPAQREARAEQRRIEAEQQQRAYRERREYDARAAEWRSTVTIEQQHRPSLCHCRTFSDSTHFISPHGYCGYCGGWTPEVFRAARGEEALSAEIDKLAIHNRVAMRKMCGLPVEAEP
jgi:hypothetical protein